MGLEFSPIRLPSALRVPSPFSPRTYWIDLEIQASPEWKKKSQEAMEAHLASLKKERSIPSVPLYIETPMTLEERWLFNADNLRENISSELNSRKRGRQMGALAFLEDKLERYVRLRKGF
ncbi:MAG TPA: hypothetical protein VKC89_01815 [Patescibacteria group bacterium]|nr:hypothetical protein [Patescibacteria group bacterium]